MINDEELIEQMTKVVKSNGDISAFKKNRKLSPFINLLSTLISIPKTRIAQFDVSRVRIQIMDRITLPKTETQPSRWFNFRVLAVGIGSFMIVVSLTLATAVTALQSVPGQAIYPLKKVVENIQLRFASENEKSNLQIKFANNRVDELQQVLQAQATGQISANDAQRIVADTVKDLQKTTSAAARSSNSQPKTVIATKLADISNKLLIASIQTEGQVRIDLEQAAQNIQENAPSTPATDNLVSATGKLTAITETSVSIGTVKFLLTKDTKYTNIALASLAVDQVVAIEGIIKDNKTYAQTIKLVSDITVTAPSPAPQPVQ